MSLISQKDRKLAMEALEHYDTKLKSDMFDNPPERKNIQVKRNELLTLINWIKLEYYKNEH